MTPTGQENGSHLYASNSYPNVVGHEMTADEVVSFMETFEKTVVTFVGYSGVGYHDRERMPRFARKELARFPPWGTVINSGATEDGIGVVYELAKSLGFATTGIVSRVCLDYSGTFSPFVDHVCIVKDEGWGGSASKANFCHRPPRRW